MPDRQEARSAATAERKGGKCWSCGRWVWLRKDGTLCSHRRLGGTMSFCEGTGKTPGESGLV